MQSLALFAAALAAVSEATSFACAPDEYVNMQACQCFKRETCAAFATCVQGTTIDPRFDCKCSPLAEIEALYDHGLDESCLPKLPPGLGGGPSPVPEVKNYECDANGNKICLAKQSCPEVG